MTARSNAQPVPGEERQPAEEGQVDGAAEAPTDEQQDEPRRDQAGGQKGPRER